MDGIADMGGTEGWCPTHPPRVDEPVFPEPWQGRAFAISLLSMNRLTGRIVDWSLGTTDVRLVTPPERERRAGIVAVAPRDAKAASDRLTRAGVVHSFREGAIRLSPHFYISPEEIDRVISLLP